MSQTILIDGWRIFMRRSALDLSDKLMEAGDSSGADQAELALARAFVLAKHGHAAKARRIIDRLPSRTHESLRVKCDRILVDAHVRVYEDRPLSSEDAGQLDWALRTLDGNDHVGQALALNQLCIFALHMGNGGAGRRRGRTGDRSW